MTRHVLTLNAGSSSIKFSLFAAGGGDLDLITVGEVEGLGGQPRLRRKGAPDRDLAPAEARDHEAALGTILAELGRTFPAAEIGAVGHRVVHGGPDFGAPVLVDEDILARLAALESWAPLHQPHNVAGLRAARAAFPKAPQIACFDTGFHHGHDFVNDAYGLPRALYESGVRRYGFHGLSYEYVARRFAEIAPQAAAGRVVVAHLGNGASVCALRAGRSVASTMGFSTLDGLPMGTRPGQLDPGVILYLLEARGLDSAALVDLLYKQSGLKGLSGLSNDMRALEASSRPEAAQAIDYFVHRLVAEIAALASTLDGLDALVFTGGIGEHSSRVRGAAMARLRWLGVEANPAANDAQALRISADTSRIGVYVLATNEERMIAEHSLRLGFAGITATLR